jgi:CubicO group peptidase (beta-lactamase class C family)
VLEAVASSACAVPGVVRYSDLGYILLGEALCMYTHTPLDAVLRAEVLAPLGLAERMHYRGVGATWRDVSIAPTERCAWRGRVVQGEVHDENAYALGGVCGHAGLFGTARDLAVLAAASLACLDGDAGWFSPERLASMIAPRAGGAHRVGWDARAEGGAATPASGSAMGARTFGHLGFTGTSLWCDPDAGLAVALVTNRVHPTRENTGIRALRPAVHDAAMVWLLGRRP